MIFCFRFSKQEGGCLEDEDRGRRHVLKVELPKWLTCVEAPLELKHWTKSFESHVHESATWYQKLKSSSDISPRVHPETTQSMESGEGNKCICRHMNWRGYCRLEQHRHPQDHETQCSSNKISNHLPLYQRDPTSWVSTWSDYKGCSCFHLQCRSTSPKINLILGAWSNQIVYHPFL